MFDRDAALDKAMTLFWQHGYEATSLADLVEATGAKAPTLYAEFVNKEGLFRAVLIVTFRALPRSTKPCCLLRETVDRALRDYFTAVATCFTSKETPAGCFIINTSAALAASSTDIANTIKSRHAMQEQALTQFLQQRQAQGELPAGRDVAQLAQFLNCVLQGMSISAREGADFDKLMQITDTTLRLWPLVLES